MRVPVYALFTKADLIAGFTEFFDDLDREKRGQVWGATFPLNKSEAGTAGLFGGEFSLLVERLNQRLLDRLQAERSPDRRTLIAGFPAQVASLAAPLGEFLSEAFGGSRLDPAPVLRGVYFTSGTQEGTPIDRLTGALARSFGIDAQRAPSLRPEQGRSYFLTRLLKEVIFGEAMLVSRDPAQVRRNLFVRAGAAALALLVALGGAAALVQTRRRTRPRSMSRRPRSPPTSRRRRRCRSIRSPMPICRDRPAAGPGARAAVRRRCPAAADPVVPRPVADRQTRRRRARGVSPRVAAHAAAAADRPPGRPDADAHRAAGIPLRGDEGLSDARLRRPAGSRPRQGMDEPRLAVAVAGPRGEGPARQPGAASRGAARPAAGEGSARRRADRGRAPHVQPRVPGGARLQHDQGLAAGARAAAVAAGRCRRRVRRARVHPPFRRAADRRRPRLLHRRRASTRCCCPTCRRRPCRSRARAGCSARTRRSIRPARRR